MSQQFRGLGVMDMGALWMNKVNDRSLLVRVLAGVTIATIAVELPVLAVSRPAPMRLAQVACVVSKTTSVFRTPNPRDPEVLPIRPLNVGTAVALVEPLPSVPPARVQIKPSGFVDYAALDCGRPTTPVTPPNATKTSVCRLVRSTVISMDVRRDSKRGAAAIAAVGANQRVFVTQVGGVTTTRKDANGEVWVEVDLQRTFGRNFGISPSFGWLSNSEPADPRSTLVNGC
ncbi:hypothetical protein ACKFKG_19160 [Phormidesmis sp. 146-35]